MNIELTEEQIDEIMYLDMNWWEANKGKYQRRFDVSREDLNKEIEDDFNEYLKKHHPQLSKGD